MAFSRENLLTGTGTWGIKKIMNNMLNNWCWWRVMASS